MKHLEQSKALTTEVVLALFRTSINGVENAKKMKDLMRIGILNVSSRSLRSMIEELRRKDVCGKGFIVSNVRNGYWYTECQTEMKAFIEQELKRMANQYMTIESLRNRLIVNKKRSDKQVQQQSLFSIAV